MTGGPRRTCVACRQVQDKGQLVRLVRRPDGGVVVDRAGTAPGRGAYVCRQAGCASRLVKSGRLSQAFKRPSTAAGELIDTVSEIVDTMTESPSGVAGERINGNVEEVRGLWQPQR